MTWKPLWRSEVIKNRTRFGVQLCIFLASDFLACPSSWVLGAHAEALGSRCSGQHPATSHCRDPKRSAQPEASSLQEATARSAISPGRKHFLALGPRDIQLVLSLSIRNTQPEARPAAAGRQRRRRRRGRQQRQQQAAGSSWQAQKACAFFCHR